MSGESDYIKKKVFCSAAVTCVLYAADDSRRTLTASNRVPFATTLRDTERDTPVNSDSSIRAR